MLRQTWEVLDLPHEENTWSPSSDQVPVTSIGWLGDPVCLEWEGQTTHALGIHRGGLEEIPKY